VICDELEVPALVGHCGKEQGFVRSEGKGKIELSSGSACEMKDRSEVRHGLQKGKMWLWCFRSEIMKQASDFRLLQAKYRKLEFN
jgi:hypothetical protein